MSTARVSPGDLWAKACAAAVALRGAEGAEVGLGALDQDTFRQLAVLSGGNVEPWLSLGTPLGPTFFESLSAEVEGVTIRASTSRPATAADRGLFPAHLSASRDATQAEVDAALGVTAGADTTTTTERAS